jgi:glutaredoxin
MAESPQAVAITSKQSPILFGTAWCPYCKAARTWFRTNKMAFTNCDVETSNDCRQQYAILRQKFGVTGVPTILYQGQVWGGYDEDQMEEIAELVELPPSTARK